MIMHLFVFFQENVLRISFRVGQETSVMMNLTTAMVLATALIIKMNSIVVSNPKLSAFHKKIQRLILIWVITF